VSAAAAAANAINSGPMCTVNPAARWLGTMRSSSLPVAGPAAAPAMEATNASSRVSRRIWRIIRPVLAPSAIWMANSLLRADDRARKRPATLAAAISNTSATTAMST
jgi:hypothetical protein